MIKTGMYFPEEELRNLFNEYDLNGNGLVDYREFTLALFGQQTKNKAPV
jgi:Ca2+-binding EF-hand superfamily protein